VSHFALAHYGASTPAQHSSRLPMSPSPDQSARSHRPTGGLLRRRPALLDAFDLCRATKSDRDTSFRDPWSDHDLPALPLLSSGPTLSQRRSTWPPGPSPSPFLDPPLVRCLRSRPSQAPSGVRVPLKRRSILLLPPSSPTEQGLGSGRGWLRGPLRTSSAALAPARIAPSRPVRPADHTVIASHLSGQRTTARSSETS